MKWARDYFNEIRKTAQRARDLEGIIEYGRIHSSAGGVHGSVISDKTAIEAARVMAAESELKQCKADISKARIIISGLKQSFPNDYDILESYYILCNTWSQVAKLRGVTKSEVYTKTLVMISFADGYGMARLKDVGERELYKL